MRTREKAASAITLRIGESQTATVQNVRFEKAVTNSYLDARMDGRLSSDVRTAIAVGCLVIFLPSVTQPQTTTETLLSPQRRISAPFERVTALRELRDGNVLVVDANAQSVFLADFEKDAVKQLGRNGAGPGEYFFPMRLFSLGGDSIGIEDGGNSRILILNAKMKFTSVLNSIGLRVSKERASGELPRTSDNQGRFYASGYSLMAPVETQPADSAPIERWKVGTRTRDTVAYFPLPPRSERILLPGQGSRAFETTPQWTVGSEGQIAIIRPNPYSVELIGGNGERVRGAPIRYRKIRITDNDKKRWIESESRPRPVLIQRPGKPGATAGLRPAKPFEPIKWPEYLPPFLESALQFAPDGLLWIQRATPVGEGQLFDVFDRRGALVKHVATPEGTRLVGLGVSYLYLARTDEDQQEFLERYSTAVERKQ